MDWRSDPVLPFLYLSHHPQPYVLYRTFTLRWSLRLRFRHWFRVLALHHPAVSFVGNQTPLSICQLALKVRFGSVKIQPPFAGLKFPR